MGCGKLAIISDTAVTQTKVGGFRGYEPVVKEVEYFLQYWDKIKWLAYLQPTYKTVYSPPLPKEVEVKALRPLGGAGLWAKVTIFFSYFNLFVQVYKVIKASQVIHVRAPAHPALCAMLLAPLFPNKTFWFKYAGSWVDSTSTSYRLQRKLLQRIVGAHIYGTINGFWPDQPQQLLTFENPSFSEQLLKQVQSKATAKDFTSDLELVYVGTLSQFKGVQLVIEALCRIRFERISCFHIIGTGDYEAELKLQAENSGFATQIVFHGALLKEQVFEWLNRCHALIIASQTEGFPKVISEAMLHGCIPLSTRVSCIDQYVTPDVGFLIEEVTVDGVENAIKQLIYDRDLATKSKESSLKSELFTYERYLNRILNEILLKTGA